MNERRSKVHYYLNQMAQGNFSQRPVTVGENSLDFDFNDPEGVKDERVAAGSIIATRSLLRAMGSLEPYIPLLSQPLVDDIDAAGKSFQESHDMLKGKLERLRIGFLHGMSFATLAEERYIVSLPQNDTVHKAYRKLEELVAPAVSADLLGIDHGELEKIGINPDQMSPVWLHTMSGFPPLFTNMHNILQHAPLDIKRDEGRNPSMRELTTIIEGSFPSFINKIASSHGAALAEMGFSIDHTTTEVRDSQYRLDIRHQGMLDAKNQQQYPSARTQCALKVSFAALKPFLDPGRPLPRYSNPLLAGHKYAARILAA